MKTKIYYFITIVILSFLSNSSIIAKNSPSLVDNADDFYLFEHAIDLYDAGQYEEALKIYESLKPKYPTEYCIPAEIALTLNTMGRYKEALKIIKPVYNKYEAPLYTTYATSLANLGKTKQAEKILKEGIKKFPQFGLFYLDLGKLDLQKDKPYAALNNFQKTMEYMPNISESYYYAAPIEFQSNDSIKEPIWGLIYAETEVLLNPGDDRKNYQMSRDMVNCYYRYCFGDGDTLNVYLTTEPYFGFQSDKDDPNNLWYKPNCGWVLAGCYRVAMKQMKEQNIPVDMTSLSSLTTFRRLMVENYFTLTDAIFGNSMYLPIFQKKIIDAGHWDAYNCFLFQSVFESQTKEWLDQHPDEMAAFVKWYLDGNNLKLDAEHRVYKDNLYMTVKKKIPLKEIESFRALFGKNYIPE